MGINGVGSFYAQNYDVPNKGRATRGKTSVDDFASMGSATSLSESSDNGKRIGLTAVGNVGYIAMYADSSTEQDPIVKVGDYEVRVKDVDPNNATKMEMFALMSYMDDKGLTNNTGMKSFNKMTAYSSQAEYNGYCSGIYDENAAWTVERDWIGILGNAKETFFSIPQTYNQGLECEKIIENLKKWSDTSSDDENTDYQKILSERKNEIYTYDVTLNVGSIGNVTDFLNTHDIRCKNFVAISADTLSKMEENPALKKKVMSAIREFCSPKTQAEINALAPPVKSAGMIVYPDGDTLYWLEGYPNDFGDMKEKKVIASEVDMANAQRIYSSSIDGNVMENDIETAMQILGTTYMRKDM